MKVTPTAIPEVLVIEPKVFGDDRGFFFELISIKPNFYNLFLLIIKFNYLASGK